MKRQHRIAGRLGQPDRSWLRLARGTSGTIDGEARWPPRFHVAPQLQHRALPAARCRPARRAVAEPLDDACDPLTVEVLAGDDDDAAAAEIESGRQNAPMPERHHRLASRGDDRLVVMQALDAPAQRVAERVDYWIAKRRNRGNLESLER